MAHTVRCGAQNTLMTIIHLSKCKIVVEVERNAYSVYTQSFGNNLSILLQSDAMVPFWLQSSSMVIGFPIVTNVIHY